MKENLSEIVRQIQKKDIIKDAYVSYLERISERSRYAKQGVLFVEFQIALRNS